MARSMPYRHQVNDIVNWNQTKALNETLFILREIGPVAFIVQEEGNEKNYKVSLGDPHSCTCIDFRKEKDLCKHICWLLLKKYKLDRDDPISWQMGLVQREINDLIFTKRNFSKVHKTDITDANVETDDKRITQRRIEKDDVCSICQEDLLNVHKPVTYCRYGCGNNVHIRCMSVWTDHKKKELNLKLTDSIPCPICRGEFGTLHVLLVEMTNSRDGKRRKKKILASIKHIGITCSNCNTNPITGKNYKCASCSYYFLCGLCFNNSIHAQHSFFFRDCPNGIWAVAPSSRVLPKSDIIQNNDVESTDHDILLQQDRPGEGSGLRQQDINRFSLWTIINKSKLIQPGHQCRICSMFYKEGDIVRKLPRCQHIFHKMCIDPWLLHRTQRCPIDDVEVLRISSVKQNQKSSISTIAEDYPCLTSQVHALAKSLSISSICSRQSATSKRQIRLSSYTGNINRSVSNRPHHLPPIKQNVNDSLSITSIRLHQNSPD